MVFGELFQRAEQGRPLHQWRRALGATAHRIEEAGAAGPLDAAVGTPLAAGCAHDGGCLEGAALRLEDELRAEQLEDEQLAFQVKMHTISRRSISARSGLNGRGRWISAALGAAGSSTRGNGWAGSGPASFPASFGAAQSRQARPEEAIMQEPSSGAAKGSALPHAAAQPRLHQRIEARSHAGVEADTHRVGRGELRPLRQ
eukprot:scaffold10351_cov62-Phaeocystis_antarctica.AAC.6